MKTAICPISNKKVNENVARGNAFLTVLTLALFIFTQNPIFIGVLLFDFLLRGFNLQNYSIFSFISKKANMFVGVKPKIINAGPKIFAARIGIIFCVAALIFTLLDLQTSALITAGIFGICAFLEAFFAFCVACEFYPFVYRFFYKSEVILFSK